MKIINSMEEFAKVSRIARRIYVAEVLLKKGIITTAKEYLEVMNGAL